MSVLSRLSCAVGDKGDGPNKKLAVVLAGARDLGGIEEVVEGLVSGEGRVPSCCVKVLYEVGYLEPELIAGYVDVFLRLLEDRNNRMVWGGMLALSTIAKLRPGEVFARRDRVKKVMAAGSVITMDAGMRTLAGVAAAGAGYRRELMPFLLGELRSCRPKSLPKYAENVAAAVTDEEREEFVGLLKERMEGLSAAQARRVGGLLRSVA